MMVKGENGAFGIEVPRDREGSFEPRLIAKDRTQIDGLNAKIIAMHARDIRGDPDELYRARGLPRPEPGDPQGDQDPGLVPVGRCRREVDLPRHPKPKVGADGPRMMTG
jgi:Transposase, Mutator family